MTEFWCPHCLEWQDSVYSESHFEYIHGNKGYTFEKLKERFANIGGLVVRESVPDDTPVAKKKSNWLFNEEDGPDFIVTNNFRHPLK